MPSSPQQRIPSIDAFKFLAICGVVWIHAEPLQALTQADPDNGPLRTLYHLTQIPCRMAVPFFFTVSGFFLYRLLADNRPYPDYLKRLVKIFAVWSLFYMLVPTYHHADVITHGWLRAIYWGWLHVYHELILDPVRLLTVGGKVHLWFIWALGWGSFLLMLFHKYRKIGWGMAAGAVLYAFVLSQKAYSALFTFETGLRFQHGPYVPLIFLITGYLIAGQKDQTRHAWLLTLSGLLLMTIERMALVQLTDNPRVHYEFLIGTVPCAAGLLKLALKYPDWGRDGRLAAWGRLTLGVYLIHMVVLELLFIGRDYLPGIAWTVLLPLLTVIFSLVFVQLLWKNKYLQTFVS